MKLAPVAGTYWTESELEHIERLRTLCGMGDWELVCGDTEENDPWCVVGDGDGTVLLHLARLNRHYVVRGSSGTDERVVRTA
jgi:hypothetical protein